jgi:glycosyltransferase involved in cell wall biosynthesis
VALRSIDVVIPNYNYGRHLRGCVESVLSQGVDALRVLIIDNASTDNSAAVAREIAAADPRVELRLRRKNQGPHASFNEGIDWARSDYFLILCSDDMLAPGALKSAIDAMEEHPEVHLTYGATRFVVDDEAAVTVSEQQQPEWKIDEGSAFLRSLCKSGRNFVSGPTVVVRTAIQKRVGHYNVALTHTDDLEMWLRISLHGAVAATDRVQAIARVHASNQSATVGNLRQWSVEFEAAFTSFFSRDGAELANSVLLLQEARRALSDRAYWSGISLMCRGEPGGRALIWRALKLRPSAAVVPPFGYLLNRDGSGALVRRALSALSRRITRAA